MNAGCSKKGHPLDSMKDAAVKKYRQKHQPKHVHEIETCPGSLKHSCLRSSLPGLPHVSRLHDPSLSGTWCCQREKNVVHKNSNPTKASISEMLGLVLLLACRVELTAPLVLRCGVHKARPRTPPLALALHAATAAEHGRSRNETTDGNGFGGITARRRDFVLMPIAAAPPLLPIRC